MTDQPVEIAEYDERWPGLFDAEAALLRAVIGTFITDGIHHIGSTSVPGLAAKPVIDIMAGVEDLEQSRRCIELVAPLNYLYAPYKADVEHWFCKPDPGFRTHHLHLVPTGSARFRETLAFRDHLREDDAVAAEYAALKRDLAARHGRDRDAYTDAKGDFVAEVLARAPRHGPARPS